MVPITPGRVGQVDQPQRQTGGTPHINLTSTELNRLVYDVRSRLNQAQNGFSTRPAPTEEKTAQATVQAPITKTPLNLHPDINNEPATYQPAFSLAPGASDLEALATLAPQFRPLAVQLVRERAALQTGGQA
ncbi:MAG: hypothetical protein KKC80_00105 [Candidatus Margulisbacteria bacterium]|nr:hypothetical protein [Candidatus Margulisiibacteriota bacterium]MBU1617790.1 hypothetical protein [Candidatus Margulisiibacteriota bacterium]